MKENTTETTDTRAPFVIDTEDKAAWCLRKMKANRDELEAVKVATARRVEELEADYRAMLSKWAQPLESWAIGESERRRRQTITLPLAGCSLCFRTPKKGKLIETDGEGPARAEVAATLGFMTPPVEPAPDLRKLVEHARQWFEESGEVLPGFEYKQPERSFKIDFSLKGDTATE